MASHVATTTDEAGQAFDLQSEATALPGHRRLGDKEVLGLYATGYELYSQGRPDKALSFLILAAMYRPAERRYVLALGICQKALKRYDSAMDAFAMATILDPTDPQAALHVAECLLALERRDEAAKLLESVVVCARLDGEQDAVLQRAEAILSLLRKP